MMLKARSFRHLVVVNSRGLFISVNFHEQNCLSQDNRSLGRILRWDFPYMKMDFCHFNREFLILLVCTDLEFWGVLRCITPITKNPVMFKNHLH